MKFVCPKPIVWDRIYQRLRHYWQQGGEAGPEPPVPLILGGWNFSSDYEKNQRWLSLIEWAREAGCPELIPKLTEEEGHWVPEYCANDGVPNWYLQSNEPKKALESEGYRAAMEAIKARWVYVAGPELADIAIPFLFAGAKGRNLVVVVEPGHTPPWGTWTTLSAVESERRTFTLFRKRVNEVIAPHEVDHVTFRERGA